MLTENDLMNISLPKWPAMIVRGMTIEVEQAKEIIRRTDSFFHYMGMNSNFGFEKGFCNAIKMPKYSSSDDFEKQLEWRKAWGVIPIEYIYNDWVSSSFVYGPNGWCNPNGTISFDFNVGKWPSVRSLLVEWKMMVKNFPFLELGVNLMDKESCEEDSRPLVSIHIKDGKVKLIDPNQMDVVSLYGIWPKKDFEPDFKLNPKWGVPLEWLDDWAEMAKDLIK
jgi:hypothetical protein